MKIKPKIKAFLVLTDGNFLEFGGGDRRVAIYETLERAEERVDGRDDILKIVPCEITYSLGE